MKRIAAQSVAVACLLAACTATALAGSQGQGVELSDAAQQLIQKYPGVQVMTEMGRVSGFYGKPMTSGATTDAAVVKFLDAYGPAFGVGDLDLRLTRVNDLSFGKFDVFAYEQFIDDLEVEYGMARVLVLKGQDTNRVVYAAGKLARKPAGGFAPDTVSAEQAVAIATALPEYKDLPVLAQPKMVVYYGEGDLRQWIDATRAWKFTLGTTSLINPLKLSVFVDAATGQVLHVRSEIYHADVTGNIQAKVTPGTKPDTVTNPPVLLPVKDIQAFIGATTAYTDASGNFTLTNPGTSPVVVGTRVGTATAAGRFIHIDDQTATAEISLTQTVTPPGPANFVLNNTPSVNTTAQMNCFFYINKTHDYVTDRAPTFTGLDMSIIGRVNLNQTCNAYFDSADLSVNFFSAGGGCVNTAYANVMCHEYGHFIVNRLGLTQGSFGEGYGDTTGMLLQDTGIIGDDWQGPGTVLRTPFATVIPTGCGDEAHTCGMTLAGSWYGIRQNLGAKYGSGIGLDMTRQMEIDWSMMTLGGVGNDSAAARTAIEVLTVNDTDGDIGNGTPDYAQICSAFSTRSISCPVLSLIDFLYPDGVPSTLTPNAAKTFRVNVVPLSLNPAAGTGKLTYRIDGSAFTTVNMTETAPNQYTATLPAVSCLSKVDYYVSASTTGGTVVTDPDTAPVTSFTARATVGTTSTNVFTDDMQTDKGWTTGPETAATGRWNRMDPQATDAQPGDDHTAGAGTICWVTDGNAGGSVGDFDVDGGQTVLNSPVFNLSGYADGVVSYWRWYSNDAGANPGTKTLKVDVSNNGGSTWTRAETVGPTGPETHAGWFFHQFNVKDFVTPTANIKVRIIADDLGSGSGSVVEAAIDDFQVAGIQCPVDCLADLNGDGIVDFADYLEFLNLYDAGDLAVDFNHDGIIDFSDYLEFLNLYDAGC